MPTEPTTSDQELDGILLAEVQTGWLKVAMVISRALPNYQDWDTDDDTDRITARMLALVENGKIERQGDVRLWRFSEVRLVQPPS